MKSHVAKQGGWAGVAPGMEAHRAETEGLGSRQPVADEVGETPKPMRNSNTHVRDLRPLLILAWIVRDAEIGENESARQFGDIS
ncbi:MAG: hypothetical protein IPG56_17995 [Caulobacteraceae bacterium]|nr:hypothetical protein [Caulobacteraceae bacterium]